MTTSRIDSASNPLRRISKPRALGAIAVAAALGASLTATLSGCYSGFGATTTMQSQMNSGNGVQVKVGTLRVENATLVQAPEGATGATLLMTVFNEGPVPDELTTVLVDGVAATPGDPIALSPGGSVAFAFNSETWRNACSLEAMAGSYVPVTLEFRDAGIVQTSLLVVPNAGYYEGIGPNPHC